MYVHIMYVYIMYVYIMYVHIMYVYIMYVYIMYVHIRYVRIMYVDMFLNRDIFIWLSTYVFKNSTCHMLPCSYIWINSYKCYTFIESNTPNGILNSHILYSSPKHEYAHACIHTHLLSLSLSSFVIFSKFQIFFLVFFCALFFLIWRKITKKQKQKKDEKLK